MEATTILHPLVKRGPPSQQTGGDGDDEQADKQAMQKRRALYPTRNPQGTISGHHDNEESGDQGRSQNGTMGIQAAPVEESEQGKRQRETEAEGHELSSG